MNKNFFYYIFLKELNFLVVFVYGKKRESIYRYIGKHMQTFAKFVRSFMVVYLFII